MFDLEVSLDLTDDGGPSGVLFTSEALDSQVVWILGCLDADANGCDDPGDPVTLPSENKFQVVAGEVSAITVNMGILRP